MRIRTLILAITAAFVPFSSFADVVISGPLTPVLITAGGTVTVSLDILPAGVTSGLQQYGAEFTINPVGSPGDPTIVFSHPLQPDSYLDNPTSPSNYVFFGNSSSVASPPPNIGDNITASRVAFYDTTMPNRFTALIIDDTTNDNSDATITSSNQLLVQLTFSAPTNAVAGDTFTLNLLAGPNTFFDSSTQAYVPDYTPVTFQIVGVPEPGVFTMAGVGIVAAVSWRRLVHGRKRKVSGEPDGLTSE